MMKNRRPRVTREGAAVHLFDVWPHVAKRVGAARSIRVILDFDGTLVPISPRPALVRVTVATRGVLGRLARHQDVGVIILSGRRRAELIKHLKTSGIRYLGLHGWEGSRRPVLPRREIRLLRLARRRLLQPLGKLRGIRIEDKGFIFAVHHRGARPATVKCARRILRESLRQFETDLRVLEGDRVWEIVPRQVEGKGAVIRSALQAGGRSLLPIYVGNDQSDESAFQALRRGITVRVGQARDTAAHYRLRNPNEVRKFLERLESALS